jgi:nucleotide-binding universal stress UspA family protein
MKILTALDRSDYAEVVLEHGLDQAARHPDAELHFMTAISDERDYEAVWRGLASTVREGLETFGLTDRHVELHVPRGQPAPAISALAHHLGVELLVLGRFHSPSVSETVVQMVDVPTLVVGLDGHVLEPQCPECREERRASRGEHLFCTAHLSKDPLELSSWLPSSTLLPSRMW